MEFEWDRSKERENVRKHKVTFMEAVESFFDPRGFVLTDAKHSHKEQRFYWVGKTSGGKVLTTRYTRRGSRIRIIGSAEWREFRRLYYEKTERKKSER